MGSTRLPGKTLKEICGRPMLSHVVERAARTPGVDAVVVATTVLERDNVIVEWTQKQPNVGLFRGSEDDVLSRYHGAAEMHNADVVVRMTSDCPLLAPVESSKCIRAYLDDMENLDYVSNVHSRTYPYGTATEVMSFEVLDTAFREAELKSEREHVTSFIWSQKERFRLLDIASPINYGHYRWTVDTPEDFELVSRIYNALYEADPHFDYAQVLALMLQHPEWLKINDTIVQKAAYAEDTA
ncbi:MAG TPA: acylneuraminate cytidylyltransferase [Myxococcales bacterium]|nr:acylneuraminate cytidylyltransferase [Myxococcales bacterium]